MKSKLTAIVAGPSLWALASATQAAPAETKSDEKAAFLGEIVVTARRKEETLQEVPQTVNVVTDEKLKEFVILDFQDISQLVPGLTLEGGTTGYQSNASVRGVRFSIEAQASGPTTEFYVNEAPMEANSVFQAQYDLGQIEVLKGPQGTVRGRSAPSGAFTLTTRPADPSGGFNGYVATTFDDHDGINLQGAVNLPIIENMLAVRLAGLKDENDANGIKSITAHDDPSMDTNSYRASLTFKPWDAFSARFMYQHLNRTQSTFGSMLEGPGATPANPNQPPLTLAQERSVRDNPSTNEQRIEMATLNLEYVFAGQALSYIGGWFRSTLEDDSEGDGNNFIVGPALPLNNGGAPQVWRSHELRLASAERLFNGTLDYTVGVFYQSKQDETDFPSPTSYFPGTFGAAGAVNSTIFNDDYLRVTRVKAGRDDAEKSIFTGIDLHLTKSLDLSLGGRHIISQRDQKIRATQEGMGPGGVQRVNLGVVTPCTGSATGTALFGAVAGNGLGTGTREPSPFYSGTCDIVFTNINPLTLGQPVNDEIKTNVWNASLSYKINDDIMVYGTSGTSFRNGPGFVTGGPGTSCFVATNCLQFVTLTPEESLAFELGLKAYLFDRRSYFELSAFQQTFDGFIVRGIGVPYRSNRTPGVATGVFTYNADAVVKGFDALFNYDVTDAWNAGLSVAYADGKYDNARIPCRDSNFDGTPDANPLPGATAAQPLGTGAAWDLAGGPTGPALCTSNGSTTRAPLWNGSLQSRYEFPLFASTTGFVRGLYTYYPDNKNASDDQNFVVDAYGVLNLYAGVRSNDRAWEVSAFVKNVMDEDTLRSHSDDLVSAGFTNPVTSTTYFSQTVRYRSFSRVAEREIGVTLRYNFGR